LSQRENKLACIYLQNISLYKKNQELRRITYVYIQLYINYKSLIGKFIKNLSICSVLVIASYVFN